MFHVERDLAWRTFDMDDVNFHVVAWLAGGLVACNIQFGTERSGMAGRSAPSARRRSEARVAPLASFGNAAIGADRSPDSPELGVTGH